MLQGFSAAAAGAGGEAGRSPKLLKQTAQTNRLTPKTLTQVGGRRGDVRGRLDLRAPAQGGEARVADPPLRLRPLVGQRAVPEVAQDVPGARAAAPVVKCVFTQLSGATAADPVVLSDPLDTNDLTPAPSQSLRDICARSL